MSRVVQARNIWFGVCLWLFELMASDEIRSAVLNIHFEFEALNVMHQQSTRTLSL